MKRKLVEQGGTTMMVSLPSKWIKRFELKKGDEVDVEIDGKQVHVSSETVNRTRQIQVNLEDTSPRVMKWVISGLHKFGYDEIEVIYNTSETLDTIDWLVKNLLIGFTVIEQTAKRIVLKNVTQDTDIEFDSTLRRAFRVTLSLAESALDTLVEGDTVNAEKLISLEQTNNQLTNYCERILNKRGYVESKKTLFMYTIIWNLEKVADDYKYICQQIGKYQKAPYSESLITCFTDVNTMLKGYYELFYTFEYTGLLQLQQQKDDILDRLINHDVQGQPERQIIYYLQSIVYKLADFSTSMVCVHLKEV